MLRDTSQHWLWWVTINSQASSRGEMEQLLICLRCCLLLSSSLAVMQPSPTAPHALCPPMFLMLPSPTTSYIVSPTFVMLPSPTAPHALCPPMFLMFPSPTAPHALCLPTFVMLPSPTTLHTLCPPIFLLLRNPRALHTLFHLYFSCYQVPEHLIHCFIHICHVTKSHNTSFIVSTYISDVIKSQCISHITPPTFLMLLSSRAIHTHYTTHISDVAKL